jgi:hypothetical protein
MSGISRMIAKQLSASLGLTDEARPALRMTDQPPKVSYDIYGRAAGESVAEFYSPSVEVLNEITIPKKGLLGRDAIIALDKAPETRIAEIETIRPLLDENKRYTREELSDILETSAFKVQALRSPFDDIIDHTTNIPNYSNAGMQRQYEMLLEPEFEEMDYQETIITAIRPTEKGRSLFGTFESSGGQHFTEETLGHFRHSIQKDTRTFEPLYLIEEIQSDLLATGAVKPRTFKGNYIETFKSDIEGKVDVVGSRIFADNKTFLKDNKEFLLDYAAAYAESANETRFTKKEPALEGALEALNSKYNFNIVKPVVEDIKPPTIEDLPRVSYKGTPEALEEAREILEEPNLSGEELVNNLIVYDEADWDRVPENYNTLINYLLDEDGAELYKALNYEKDFYDIRSKYNLRAISNSSTFDPKYEALKQVRESLNDTAKKYLQDKATDVVDAGLFKTQTIPNSLRFLQSLAIENANRSKEELSRAVSPAPVKKLEEITKLVLQTAIKDAAANGVKKIAIPNVERIAALREKVGSPEYKSMIKTGSSFYKVYDRGVKKALNDIKKSMPEIKVYKDEIPYGETTKVQGNFEVEYTGDAISLIKARRILEEVREGASLGQDQRPISGKALIENILKYNNADWDIIPRPYQELLERLDYVDGLQEGLGLPAGEGGLIRMADDYGYTAKGKEFKDLPKDATFIDITPYINKDYVLRFNKGGLVERPTK